MFVKHYFELSERTKAIVRDTEPNFGYNGFGEIAFYRTYSRRKEDGSNESWADVMIRVTEGTFSIRKDWYVRNNLFWDEGYWQAYAYKFIISMFKMHWLPPGRGLWAMGTKYIYERGSMALNNCGGTLIENNRFAADIGWGMDALMNGVGVGYRIPVEERMKAYEPRGKYDYVIPDTREGWVESTQELINAFLQRKQKLPRFIYDKIRPEGSLIRGFGGICSGPEPLKLFHEGIIAYFHFYLGDKVDYSLTKLKADIANGTGNCVVAGNVRRSAEMLIGSLYDQDFMDLKDYRINPYRENIGWMSNNSVALMEDRDFERMAEIADRVKNNGEPGFINFRNFPYGRIGKHGDEINHDRATISNPCGEQQLENKELCNVVETCPTKAQVIEDWYEGVEHATFYASTTALLLTHSPETNRVMIRNRRIGVSIVDVTGWIHDCGINQVIKHLRKGYRLVRKINGELADDAGVPHSNKVTTIKPGGTVPKLPGKTPGIGFPTFIWTIRRIRVQKGSPIEKVLMDAAIPFEEDRYSMNTNTFEYPIMQGPAKPAIKASLWEQAMLLVMMQREWSDNAVSNTLYFKPAWPILETYKPSCTNQDCKFIFYVDGLGEERLREYTCPKCGTVNNCVTYMKYLLEGIEKEYCVKSGSYGDPDFRIKTKEKGGVIQKIEVLKYDPLNEEDDIESVLASVAPLVKSVSMLPHSTVGAYPQMPEEGITEEVYEQRLAAIKPINWSKFRESDGMDERYCSGPSCEVPLSR